MSDISISFPPWMIAWFLLGEATPFITLVLMGVAAAFFFSRGTGHTRRVHWLKWILAIVGALWLGGISFWAAGLVDQIKTDIYQARHHYRLDKSTVLAGIEIPKGSWISVDEEGMLYGMETARDAVVSIDGALWRGDIRLITGLDICTLASAKRVGPFDLSAETLVVFMGGRLDKFEMPPTSAPLSISGIDLPPGTVVGLCDRSWELEWLSVPEDSYVAIAGVKLTGRMNFDCGKFEYGALFEDTVLGGRRLRRGAAISYDDMSWASAR